MTSVYVLSKILDNPLFEGFGFVSDKPVRNTLRRSADFLPDDVKTMKRKWTAPILSSLWTPQEVQGRVNSFNDFPCIMMDIPAFSARAVRALKDYLEPNGELLPLVSDIGEYYAYNTRTIVDALDPVKSVYH